MSSEEHLLGLGFFRKIKQDHIYLSELCLVTWNTPFDNTDGNWKEFPQTNLMKNAILMEAVFKQVCLWKEL